MSNHGVTIPPYHISIVPLKSINHALSSNIKPNTLIEIEEKPFLSIEQLDLIITPMLQRLGLRIPNVYMAVLWNPGGQVIILKRNTTISYARESDYMKKKPYQWENIGKMIEIPHPIQHSDVVTEVTEISYEKLPPMPEKSAFMFHNKLNPKPKTDLKDAEISEETRYKLQVLWQDYDDIGSEHSGDIRLTYLEEMTIYTDPNLPTVMSKSYPLPLKHHNFVKEEIENLL